MRSARKCENLLDRQHEGNKSGYKWCKIVCRGFCRGSGEGKSFLEKQSGVLHISRGTKR